MISKIKKLKNDVKIKVYLNEDGEIHNCGNKPAVEIYKDEITLGAIFVNKGVISDYKNRPAIKIKKDKLNFIIRVRNGLIHKDNEPAIILKNNKNEISHKYYYKNGKINNINGAAIVQFNDNNRIDLFINNNKAPSGYNCKIYNKKIINTKASVELSFETDISMSLNEYNLENIIERLTLYIKAINQQTQDYTYRPKDKYPNVVNYKENKLDSFMWFNEKGLNRINKPAYMKFNKTNVQSYFFKDGLKVESVFMPHYIRNCRKGSF